MAVLCSMPGRHGDILWSLPTVRALADAHGEPVTMAISGKYGSLKALIEAQPYVKQCLALPNWEVQETAPMTPRVPTGTPALDAFEHQYHLGYGGWPEKALPFECERIANITRATRREPPITIDLTTPWIQAEPWEQVPHDVVFGWSDEHFELKYGLTLLLARSVWGTAKSGFQLCAPGSRWETEGGFDTTDWLENAQRIAGCKVFVGCCSALHVLAVAMGKPVIVMEPNPQRHADVFYPLGKVHRVHLVLGGDGQPTHDARHVKDAVEAALRG